MPTQFKWRRISHAYYILLFLPTSEIVDILKLELDLDLQIGVWKSQRMGNRYINLSKAKFTLKKWWECQVRRSNEVREAAEVQVVQ